MTKPWMPLFALAPALLFGWPVWWRFDNNGAMFQLVEEAEWVPTLGMGFRLEVDGIALAVAAMSALLFTAAVAYPVDTRGSARQYYAWLLFLDTLTTIAAFASLGLPGLAGFVAEFHILVGTFGVYPWLAGIALLGLLISAALFLRMLQSLFFGELPERWRSMPDLNATEFSVLGVLLGLVVLMVGPGLPNW